MGGWSVRLLRMFTLLTLFNTEAHQTQTKGAQRLSLSSRMLRQSWASPPLLQSGVQGSSEETALVPGKQTRRRFFCWRTACESRPLCLARSSRFPYMLVLRFP